MAGSSLAGGSPFPSRSNSFDPSMMSNEWNVVNNQNGPLAHLTDSVNALDSLNAMEKSLNDQMIGHSGNNHMQVCITKSMYSQNNGFLRENNKHRHNQFCTFKT